MALRTRALELCAQKYVLCSQRGALQQLQGAEHAGLVNPVDGNQVNVVRYSEGYFAFWIGPWEARQSGAAFWVSEVGHGIYADGRPAPGRIDSTVVEALATALPEVSPGSIFGVQLDGVVTTIVHSWYQEGTFYTTCYTLLDAQTPDLFVDGPHFRYLDPRKWWQLVDEERVVCLDKLIRESVHPVEHYAEANWGYVVAREAWTGVSGPAVYIYQRDDSPVPFSVEQILEGRLYIDLRHW